jgi:S1-C subfamily serine protease
MHRLGTHRPSVCAYNDLALVRVGRRHVAKVNPSVPFWGGPTGLSDGTTTAGDRVYSYGNSSLRAGLTALAPRTGASLGDDGRHWSHTIYTATPGIPGDSGSAFMTASGKALGVLSTIAVAPLAGSNGVGDLRRELDFARRHAGIPGLRLVRGTVAFQAPL